MLTIRKVESVQDFRAYAEFPWQVYKDDPNWVPPLLSMRYDLLDKQKNPEWNYLQGDYFAAWRGDQIVGTIAAFINQRHNESNHDHIGWFGAFDVYDDEEAALALLNTAADWVQSRGYDAIAGPQTFTTHGDCGILVDGFMRPVLLMPYNHPYYQRMVECAGFQKLEDLYSFHLSRQQAQQIGLLPRLQRVTNSVMKRNHIRVRPIDRRHLRDEFRLFKDLYNGSFDDTGGFFPLTPAELDGLVKTLGRFFDPNFAFFAYVRDEPVGFVIGVPDYNQVLKKAAARPGVPEFITLLRGLWYWKIHPVMDWIRVALIGVKQSYRRKGVDVALCGTLVQAIFDSGRMEHADAGWTSEKNIPSASLIRNLGLETYKTHRLYEKRFTASGR